MTHAANRSGRASRSRRKATTPAADTELTGQGPQPDSAEPQARSWKGQLAYALVLIGAVIALVIIRQGIHLLKSGTLVLAGVLLAAATARLLLPDRRAGMLASRRRSLDVAILGTLGVGLLIGGIVVPTPD
jgi:hypothetical protein